MPRGLKFTQESLKKMSLSHIGKKRTEKTKRKISIAHKGIPLTEEHKTAIRLATKGKNGKWMKGRKMSQSTKDKQSRSHSGELSYRWVGDDVGYRGVHHWVAKKLGKPRTCAICCDSTKIGAKAYHWANISRCYKRELSDWIRLCAVCHKKFDLGKIDL